MNGWHVACFSGQYSVFICLAFAGIWPWYTFFTWLLGHLDFPQIIWDASSQWSLFAWSLSLLVVSPDAQALVFSSDEEKSTCWVHPGTASPIQSGHSSCPGKELVHPCLCKPWGGDALWWLWEPTTLTLLLKFSFLFEWTQLSIDPPLGRWGQEAWCSPWGLFKLPVLCSVTGTDPWEWRLCLSLLSLCPVGKPLHPGSTLPG